MKKNLIVLTIAAAGLFSCESQRNTAAIETSPTAENVPDQNTADASVNSTEGQMASEDSEMAIASDAEFVEKAAQSGMAEVKLSNLAERMATSVDVKRFAVQMALEHKRANALLMELARKKKWQTPAEMDKEHQEVYDKMLTVMSDEFDRVYMNQMLEDHKEAVMLFEKGAEAVQDPELKEYIADTLPSLRRHLDMAQEVYNKAIAKG